MAVGLTAPAAVPTRERLPLAAVVRPYLILLLFALTGVGWRVLGGGSGGVIRYFHIPLVLVAGVAVGRGSAVKRIEPLVIAFTIYTLVYLAFAGYNGLPPYAFQQAVYAGGAFMVLASLRRATERDWRILRWAGPAALLVFLLFFFADAAAVGVNVLGTYQVALRTGNLDLIQFGVFQAVFNAHPVAGVEAASTALRGQIIAGVLVSTYLTMHAAQRCGAAAQTQLFQWVARGTIAMTGLLVVLSFARYLQIVVALAALVALGRLVVLGRANAAAMAALLAGLLALALAFATPVASVVYERFTSDRGSYQERGSAFEAAIDSVFHHPLTGTNTGGDEKALTTGDRSSLSAHNFVIDAAVNGGLLLGALAGVVAGMILLDVAKGVRRFLADGSLFPAMAASILAPVVMFSAGSGTLAMPELLGLALFYAAITEDPDPELDDDLDLEGADLGGDLPRGPAPSPPRSTGGTRPTTAR